MSKTRNFLLTLLTFVVVSNGYSQEISLDKTKDILKSYNWVLTEYIQDGENKNIPNIENNVLTFDKSGVYYSFDKSNKLPLEPIEYKVTKEKIHFGELIEDAKLDYKLESENGLYFLKVINNYSGQEITYKYKAVELSNAEYALPKNRSIKIGSNRESYNSMPSDANSLISAINDNIKLAKGNLRFFSSTGTKKIIEDTYFTYSNSNLKLVVVVKEPNELADKFVYEFRPENIKDISKVSLPSTSPVGQIEIKFSKKDEVLVQVSNAKKTYDPYYTDEVFLSYLKVDEKNFDFIKQKFLKLKKLYEEEQQERLYLLESYTEKLEDFWISGTGLSQTFELENTKFTSCTMRFQYDLVSIGTKEDVKGSFLTEVPLKNITGISLDRSKSKPVTILLQTNNGSFRTFKKNSEGDFKLDKPVYQLPIFIDVSKDEDLKRVLELLTTHCKECGGNNLKLK